MAKCNLSGEYADLRDKVIETRKRDAVAAPRQETPERVEAVDPERNSGDADVDGMNEASAITPEGSEGEAEPRESSGSGSADRSDPYRSTGRPGGTGAADGSSAPTAEQSSRPPNPATARAAERSEPTAGGLMTDKPKRIQRKRMKGWRMPEGAVYVGRPTIWGNPFVVGRENLYGTIIQNNRHATSLYFGFASQNKELITAARDHLRGKDLACWCALCETHVTGLPLGEYCPYCSRCHADILLRIANA